MGVVRGLLNYDEHGIGIALMKYLFIFFFVGFVVATYGTLIVYCTYLFPTF